MSGFDVFVGGGSIVVRNLLLQATPAISQQEEVVAIRNALLYAFIPVILAFVFFVFIFYRAKREAYFKQKEAEFNFNKSELELRALRSQINPHFIFNCLNSIHHYMHRNDLPKAGDYLIKFSQLIRIVLESSAHRMITLEDDLEMLRLYIQLEQMRMDSAFEFQLKVSNDIDPAAIYVPPLLIQPLVENSIWHGLNHRQQGGMLLIDIGREGIMLKCTISDNGVSTGHKEAYDLANSVKKTSMGMALIRERLDIINRVHDVVADFRFSDNLDAELRPSGKQVTLLLPFQE